MKYLSRVSLLVGLAAAAPAADEVTSLPDYGKPPTPQYSGYLNASAAEEGTMLHYWWASAEVPKPSEAPIILWLNGGPGSSSVLGMLQEEGPLLIDKNGKLMDNPWSWTKMANLFVLESPAGVGFSYCAAMQSGGACRNTDHSTAKAAYAALQDLFTTKFPELRGNKFYVTGESYAGVYLPTLAEQIVDGNSAGNPKINLAGMAVGDPCTDNDSQRQSMNMLWYAHKNGLVMDDDYNFLVDECGYGDRPLLAAGAWKVTEKSGNVVADKDPSASLFRVGASSKCTLVHRKYLLSSSKGVSQSWEKAWINELSPFSPAGSYRFDLPGTFNYRTAQYMNRDDVRKALHVKYIPVNVQWPGPAPGWSYKSDYDACNPLVKKGTPSMVDLYRKLAPILSGKIVVYNGDTDPCVSYEGTRIAVQKVGFDVVGPYRPWFFNAENTSLAILTQKDVLFGGSLSLTSQGVQYGGSIVEYEHGLSFLTVHGAGHMVPTFRPRSALQMIQHVLDDTPFTTPVPDDATIEKMSIREFDKFLDNWVDQAKSPTYVSS